MYGSSTASTHQDCIDLQPPGAPCAAAGGDLHRGSSNAFSLCMSVFPVITLSCRSCAGACPADSTPCRVVMNGSGCSAADGPVGGVFTVEGLPPLPKGLSGILNSSGGSWRDIERVHSKRARIQADISGGDAPRGHSKPGGLDAALALLRKEMVGLRQLDMSLLCQLWSLHEAIQEYKGSSLLSEASFGAENGYSEEEEEEEEDEVEEADDEETVILSQPSSSSSSLSLPPPSSNSRDQWIKDSFHIP